MSLYFWTPGTWGFSFSFLRNDHIASLDRQNNFDIFSLIKSIYFNKAEVKINDDIKPAGDMIDDEWISTATRFIRYARWNNGSGWFTGTKAIWTGWYSPFGNGR